MERIGSLMDTRRPAQEEFDVNKFLREFHARYALIRRTKAEQDTLDGKERVEKEAIFLETLELMAEEQFGAGYTGRHLSVGGACGETIQHHIQTLFLSGRGACYCGRGGSGKTNILLEYFYALGFKLWLLKAEKKEYPDARKFIEQTIHFSYALHICNAFKAGRRVPLAEYNLIDDLGVECPSDFVMADLDGYFEEINRRGYKLVVSTNSEKEMLEGQNRYQRIYSRIKEKCRFFELPDIDYRDPKNWVNRTK